MCGCVCVRSFPFSVEHALLRDSSTEYVPHLAGLILQL